MTKNAAIRFDGVSFSADGIDILLDITAFFPKGEITSLVGPSGAGKTTVFKLCNGLRSPSKGKIYFNEQSMNTYEPVQLRRQIGLALQDATVISGTVRENLALPLTLQDKLLSEETANEYMDLVGLNKDLLNRDARDLSGGQRQKLSIARTLINQPDVLLLDEITSSLDQISRKDIEQLILKINKKYETTIIWITHSMEQARLISDYTWVMM
ncbi:MAG TPA: phosphate ABC transporter ATP-binding protein, partial [Candidatus Avamphibacillus sp.]|nr:phosphate ABC transporter ATP-binding protein [Candidatus Avamphibacillus sp.]